MLRSIKRNIARNLLKDMDYVQVNRKMRIVNKPGDKPERLIEAKMEQTAQGREKLARMRKENPPLWKRVTGGDLAKDARKAFDKKRAERQKIRRVMIFQ